MNSTQKLVSTISGYTPTENGAKNDLYYETEGQREKLQFLLDVVMYEEDEEINTDANIFNAMKFLDADFTNEDERYKAFISLK